MIMLRRNGIKALMAERGIKTQRELAEIMGMNQGQLSRLLSRDDISNVELSSIRKLCKALNCQPGDLLTFEE
tara:strand:- start:959 stop:1174 length:216 start_codon:yes stop_codon:yes gene_type:complete